MVTDASTILMKTERKLLRDFTFEIKLNLFNSYLHKTICDYIKWKTICGCVSGFILLLLLLFLSGRYIEYICHQYNLLLML